MSEGRQPKDLQGLLRFCVENTVSEDAPSSSSTEAMDKEKQEFLSKVLSATQSLDPVNQLKTAIDYLMSKLNESLESPEEIERIVDDIIIDIIGQSDFANDFFKLRGIQLINKCLSSDIRIVRTKGFEMLAEAVQNNPTGQSMVLETDLLKRMTLILDESSDDVIRVKSLYAISCLIRENTLAAEYFQTGSDGLNVLLRVIQSDKSSIKLRTKTCFLISSLCQSSLGMQESLFRLGFHRKLIAILNQEHDPSHEYIAMALRSMIGFEKTRQDCLGPDISLLSLVNSRIEEFEGKEDFLEEVDIYKDIVQICS